MDSGACMHAHCTCTHCVHSHMHTHAPPPPQQHTLQQDDGLLCALMPRFWHLQLKTAPTKHGVQAFSVWRLLLDGHRHGDVQEDKTLKKKIIIIIVNKPQIIAKIWLCCQIQVLFSDRGENLLFFVSCFFVVVVVSLFPQESRDPRG